MKFNKILSFVVSFVCLVSSEVPPAFASGVYALGDLNEDGYVNSSDASLALNDYASFSAGNGHILEDILLVAGDANFDGVLNAFDSSLILSYYAYTSSGNNESFPSYANRNSGNLTQTETSASTTTTITTTETAVETETDLSMTVYYTKTGSKYHYENPCGRGTYYPCTLDEALNEKGLEPCEKCVLH